MFRDAEQNTRSIQLLQALECAIQHSSVSSSETYNLAFTITAAIII